MTKMTDVMVDIETIGTNPDRHVIIQIAAVKFNLETQEVDRNFFDKCLTTPASRSFEEGTIEWWSQQNKQVFKDIMNRREPYMNVLNAYSEWFRDPETGAIGKYRFWSKPTTFDFMFMQSYFKDFGVHFPHHYRDATDLNSYIRGLYKITGDDNLIPTIDMGKYESAAAHNGLNDVFYQLKMLFGHIDNAKNV